MRNRTPLRVVSARRGKKPRYRAQTRGKGNGWSPAAILAGAASIGLVGGLGSVAATPGGMATVSEKAGALAVDLGLARKRAPQEGDWWPGCDNARAAGTTPIYVGEPGYREGLDGDGDGIACEPYRGRR